MVHILTNRFLEHHNQRINILLRHSPLWGAPVVGASGATHAVALTWLALHADEVLNFILLGAIRGRTLILLYVVITLLQMLSFGNQAWGVHLGGMAVGAALGFGWVDPAKWRVFRRQRVLKKQARAIEAQLRVIEGGKQKPQPRQRGDDWIN